jgi:isoleucyl-tRNA synthetase
VINLHGVDAIRWYLYTSSPPGNERRFSSDLVGEVVRNFTLTLWNTYAFFVTYANLDHWKPDMAVIPQFSSLDYWLLSALNILVRDVTAAYENYDILGATRPIETFVDQLSNWYLRRSRRRFWKSESDADKAAAYETLYQALTTVSKLLAPAMPFIADEMYQNLVRSVDETAPISIHLADWPKADESLINETLNKDMNLVMKLASLGHAARNKSNIKVRQPLSEVAFAVGSAEEAEVVGHFQDILMDELNVKAVRVLGGTAEAVTYSINPLPKQLGQKYKGLYPKIRQAILDLPVQESALKLLDGINLVVSVAGKYYEIQPEEVEVHTDAREGFEVAAEGPYLAALEIDLTPDLVNEGLTREFVRRVQALRKDGGLDIADRIRLYYTATPKLTEAVQAFEEYIKAETLAVELKEEIAPTTWISVSDSFDEEKLTIYLQKAA